MAIFNKNTVLALLASAAVQVQGTVCLIYCRRLGLEVLSAPSSETLEECGDKVYNLLMHTDDHIGLVATPINKNKDEDCPSLYFHQAKSGKVMEQVEVPDEKSDHLLYLEEFPLKNILEAFEVASAHEEEEGAEYDLMFHNCASFSLEMASSGLGMDITKDMVDHAVKNLGESGHTLEELKKHPDFEKVFPEGATIVEEHPDLVLKVFVEYYIQTHVDADKIAL